MTTRRGAAIGAVALALALLGCVSLKRTSEARFFVLRSLAEVPDAAEARGAVAVVGVLPIRLPSHLERAQLVTQVVPGELHVNEFVRWAEPLEVGVTRTVSENLARLLPEYRVVGYPWPSSTSARCRVAVELVSFGPKAGGDVELQGRWALLPVASELPLLGKNVSLRRGPLPRGAAGLDPGLGVQAMSELLADLSRQIAEGMRSLPAEESAHGDNRP
ncbi:MAG TPA: PqiC family protein [Vicinamibacteria bacterium]|nr:PqiC family protein [Vicinamibacteria bacterium]